ncbi:MAG: PDZ domain-containing protein [Planctomycetota bacterium]|jgi:hypothetical protein
MNLTHASAVSGIVMTTCTLLTPAPVYGCNAGDEDAQVVVVQRVGTQDADSKTLEISIVNGEVSVKVDGKALDADNVRKEAGRIVITDDEGNVIREMKLGFDAVDLEDMGVEFDFELGFDDDKALRKGFIIDKGGKMGAVGEPPPVMLGIKLREDAETLKKHGLDGESATVIAEVIDGLPAAIAGLETGDIIVEIDGKGPAGPKALQSALKTRRKGDRMVLSIIRDGREKEYEIRLDDFDGKALGWTFDGGAEPKIKHLEPFEFDEGHGGKIFVGPDAEIFEFRPEGFDFSFRDGDMDELRNRVRIYVHDAMKDFDADAMRQQIEAAIKHAGDGVSEHEMRVRVQDAMKTVDAKDIQEQIRVALEAIDSDEVRVHVQQALEGIDHEAIQKRIDEALRKVDREDVRRRVEEAMSRFGDDEVQIHVREALDDIDHEALRKKYEAAMHKFEFRFQADEKGDDEPFMVWVESEHEHGDDDAHKGDLETRIDALSKRVAELEQVIRKLRDQLDD